MKFVEIVERATGEVAERMGPHPEATAEKIKRGAEINLSPDWFVRLVDAEDADAAA